MFYEIFYVNSIRICAFPRENKTLRIVGEVLAGLILLFLLITAIVVPLVVNMNSSKDTAAGE